MPVSYIPNNNDTTTTTTSRRCSDPNLYSLRNIPNYHRPNDNKTIIFLPPLQDTLLEKHQQFSDTSCQERSIMIDRLIEASADIIDSIWSKKKATVNTSNKVIMPTSMFIREILKRSRATYSMLQLALFYIFRIKKLIIERIQQPNLPYCEFVSCGRRMFLAALMASSKYLNDKNYKNKTWSKIASLDIVEINATEMIFLKLIDYQLYVSKPLYDKWVSLLHEHIQKKHYFIQMKQHYMNAINHSYQLQQQQKEYHHNTTTTTTTLQHNNKNNKQYQHYLHTTFQHQHHPLSPVSSCCSTTSSSDCSSPNTPLSVADLTHTPPLVHHHGGLKRRHSSSTTDTPNKHLRRS